MSKKNNKCEDLPVFRSSSSSSSAEHLDNTGNDQVLFKKVSKSKKRENECIKNFKSFIEYYTSLKNPVSIINDHNSLERIHELFIDIKHLLKNSKDSQKYALNILSDVEIVVVYVDLFEYCLLMLQKTIRNEIYDENFTCYYFINALAQLMWCLSNFSIKFRKTFHNKNGSKILLDYLSNENIISYFILFKNKKFLHLNENFSLMKSVIGTLHNISKSENFTGLNATNILLGLAHQMKSENAYLMPIYMTLANILTDKEIDELSDTTEIVNTIVHIISICSNLISDEKTQTPRLKIDLENGCVEDICTVNDDNGIQWDLTELISGLFRISVNDKIKYHIYANCKINEYLDRIIFHGNLIEKEYAIKLLYQLSFDDNVSNLIGKDKNLISTLKTLIETYEMNSENQTLTEQCKGLLWTVENKLSNSDETLKNTIKARKLSIGGTLKMLDLSSKEVKENPKYQLMISYNNKTRDVCLKIKESLEKIGYKIWIDVESIHGSSLEAMALAIENSDCILICK